MSPQPFPRPLFHFGDQVLVSMRGRTVRGEIRSGRVPFYPDSTVTKYGNGTMGRIAWGYKVRYPIVQLDGSLYMVRGQVAMGIGYVEETHLEGETE